MECHSVLAGYHGCERIAFTNTRQCFLHGLEEWYDAFNTDAFCSWSSVELWETLRISHPDRLQHGLSKSESEHRYPSTVCGCMSSSIFVPGSSLQHKYFWLSAVRRQQYICNGITARFLLYSVQLPVWSHIAKRNVFSLATVAEHVWLLSWEDRSRSYPWICGWTSVPTWAVKSQQEW